MRIVWYAAGEMAPWSAAVVSVTQDTMADTVSAAVTILRWKTMMHLAYREYIGSTEYLEDYTDAKLGVYTHKYWL